MLGGKLQAFRLSCYAGKKVKQGTYGTWIICMRCNHFERSRSKGYGITLVAEMEKGIRYAVDITTEQPRSSAESLERSRIMETGGEMGERATLLLLEEL